MREQRWNYGRVFFLAFEELRAVFISHFRVMLTTDCQNEESPLSSFLSPSSRSILGHVNDKQRPACAGFARSLPAVMCVAVLYENMMPGLGKRRGSAGVMRSEQGGAESSIA